MPQKKNLAARSALALLAPLLTAGLLVGPGALPSSLFPADATADTVTSAGPREAGPPRRCASRDAR